MIYIRNACTEKVHLQQAHRFFLAYAYFCNNPQSTPGKRAVRVPPPPGSSLEVITCIGGVYENVDMGEKEPAKIILQFTSFIIS